MQFTSRRLHLAFSSRFAADVRFGGFNSSGSTRASTVSMGPSTSLKTGPAIELLLEWLGLSVGKFYHWRQPYGRANQQNGRA